MEGSAGSDRQSDSSRLVVMVKIRINGSATADTSSMVHTLAKVDVLIRVYTLV